MINVKETITNTKLQDEQTLTIGEVKQIIAMSTTTDGEESKIDLICNAYMFGYVMGFNKAKNSK